MPKIRIREVDNTGVTTLGEIPNIVYIPCPAEEAVEPKLFTSAKDFEKECGLTSCAYVTTSAACAMAHHLLCKGMQVLFEGVVGNEVESGSGSGSNPTIDWNRLADKALYDIRFLTTGAFFCPSKDMIECAAKRCDAVALLDTSETDVNSIRNSLESIATVFSDLDTTKDPASFAAAFVPTISMNLIGLDNKVETWEHLPASFGYLCAFAESVHENPMWYAVAGSFRGSIPGLVGVDKVFSTAEIEMLQARAKTAEVALDGDGDNVGRAINPIAYVREFGYLVWGNRTFRNNEKDDDGTGLMKATSYLNDRVLSTEVAKSCYRAARKYMFEQNTEILWANFTSQIIPLLERMEYGNGILDYSIEKVPTTKKARLSAKVNLIPIEAVEDFDVTIELTDNIVIAE